MVVMATFGVGVDLVPAIDELTLMPVTSQWIPVSDAIEQHLVERLVRDGRKFVKLLQYNLADDRPFATAILTDTDNDAVPLFVQQESAEERAAMRMSQLIADAGSRAWTWDPGRDAMPALPEQSCGFGVANA